MNFADKNQNNYSSIPAVYLHIPFCREICPFCSFAVRRDRANLHGKYIRGVVEEIKRRAEFLKETPQNKDEEKLSGENLLESIYFGGGTPSRLTIPELSLLLREVRNCFPWSDNIEISFEMNPEDVNPEYLSDLAEIGVNRLSLGGQSFHDSTLKQLGRCHSSLDLRDAITVIANSPINNWNLDLMFGIPEQSVLMFKNDVEEALSCEHRIYPCMDWKFMKRLLLDKISKSENGSQNIRSNLRKCICGQLNASKKPDYFNMKFRIFPRRTRRGKIIC